jgi:hypothetical protein
MDNQPVTPTGPNPFSSPTPPNFGGAGGRGSGLPVLPILIGVLGLGALTFAVLTVVFYSQATTATKTLNTQKAAAAAKARADQQKADDAANTIANESPFRSYLAPVEYGSFEIKFPKDWSSSVDQEGSGTQVDLIINPDFVRRTNGNNELSAAHIMLIERSSDQYMSGYTSLIKTGKLKQANIAVAGQQGFDITGSFPDRRTTRQVIIPVRDKVLVFTNENGKYASEFNEILAQSKIVP